MMRLFPTATTLALTLLAACSSSDGTSSHAPDASVAGASGMGDSPGVGEGGAAGEGVAAQGGGGGGAAGGITSGGASAGGSGGANGAAAGRSGTSGGATASGGGGAAGAASGGTSGGSGGNAGNAAGGAPPSPDAGTDGGASRATPGRNLVAIDTPRRTYLDLVDVPASGAWSPDVNGFPALAKWETETTYSALRFQPFTAGTVLTPAEIIRLLPQLAKAARTIDITAAPYNAAVAPADASTAIQAALDAAKSMATLASPVDVLVPAGTFNHSRTLTVGADVRLRRWPEDTGGILHGTNSDTAAVHLAGDRSAALFLSLTVDSSSRATTPESCGIWVGAESSSGTFLHDTWVVGNDVQKPAGAHVFAIGEDGGTWAFNYAHDGYADNFHHTGRSRYCQVVGNRAQTSSDRGDDFYAFVGYQGDGDPVHHCSCIGNWGRDGHARGLSAVGAGFIAFEDNDIDRTQAAGVYLAQETSYTTYGTFDITVTGNTVNHANLGSSHDGLLAYSDNPSQSVASTTFGSLSSQVRRIVIQGNTFSNTAKSLGNGYGIEVRSSVDTGDVSGNTLTANQPPGLVVNGTNFTKSANVVTP